MNKQKQKAPQKRPAHKAVKKAPHKLQKRTLSTEVAATTEKKLLEKTPSKFTKELNRQRKAAYDELISDRLLREKNFVAGQANKVEKSKLPPVYPFQPYAVNPYTGDYAVRPGKRTPGVIDLNTPLASQILDYKRRIVNSRNKVTNPDNVVGDLSVYQSRVDSNRERMEVLFDDSVRPFLNRQTRVSPIYKDTIPEKRTPRTPLPADTVSAVSPTAGVLHAYRMHWVRMYLQNKRKQKVWEEMIPFDNVYSFDSSLPDVPDAANQAGLQEFMHLCKGVAAARNSNFVPTDTMAYLGGIKKMLPVLAKVNTVEVVKIRRRKK